MGSDDAVAEKLNAFMADAVAEKLNAFMAAKRTERYFGRGRYLKDADTAVLKRRWLSIYRKWAKNLRTPLDHRLREDIQAELDFRGEELPVDVRACQQFSQALREAMADPEQPDPHPELDEFLQTLDV